MSGRKQTKSWEEIYRDLEWALKNAKPRPAGRAEPRAATAADLGRRVASAIGSMPRRSKAVALASVLGAACALKLTGCGRAAPGSVTVPADVFRSPAPGDAEDHPGVAGAGSAGDAISASLAVIHERLRELQSAYRDKGRIEGDLGEVAGQLRPLIAAARADCDAIRRAAGDLLEQLPLAEDGYASAGASYRRRAEGYRDPGQKAMTLGFAAQFDALAADTPRRMALTERFLEELDDTQAFLAETERCLRDAEAALAIFSGGARMPAVSTDARSLGHRLGQFIEAVLDYEKKLLETPRAQSGEGGRGGPEPDPRPAALPAPGPAAPPDPGATGRQAAAEDIPESDPLAELESLLASEAFVGIDTRNQALAARTRFASSRSSGIRADQHWDPLPVGSRLEGEITTPSHAFRNPVRLEVIERSGDTFAGVMHYTGALATGRRGVRGSIAPDGRGLTFWAEWYEGNVSPEAIRYDLARDAGGFAGSWSTQSLRGTIRLATGTM
jgi:hypothetical protein